MDPGPTIEFRLDRQSGVPAYRQLVDQVRQALRLGILRPGDRLPTVRDVVRQIAINPNTCLLYTSPSPRDRTRSRMPSSA